MTDVLIDNMLIRLKAYRKGKSMSQEKFADSLGIKQTYYSQVENGKISLSHDLLKVLYRSDCDIDYIVIGTQRKHNDNYMLDLLENCKPEHVKNVYIMMINGFFNMWKWNLSNHWEKCLHSELRVMGVMGATRVNFEESLHYIRVVHQMSQQQLSNILGIGRTKCGKCEHGEKKLDAQLMINLYIEGYCLPSFFIEKYVGITEIASLLETNMDIKNRYYSYLDNVVLNFTCDD